MLTRMFLRSLSIASASWVMLTGATAAAAQNLTYPWGYSLTGNRALANFQQIFDKGCTSPSDYVATKGRLSGSSNSADAWATRMVYPQRNIFQVFTTDISIYELYLPDPCYRASRMQQCVMNQTYSAEQACDCAEGYVGDVSFGAGAGEAIAQAYHDVGERSCRAAATGATGRTRARYLAQLGRAQLYAPRGTYDAGVTLRQAIAAGYGRANIDLARAYIRDVEFGGQGYNYLVNVRGLLSAGRRAGARETSVVLQSMTEVATIRQWNVDFARTWIELSQ